MPHCNSKTPQIEKILKLCVSRRNNNEGIEIQAHSEVYEHADLDNRMETIALKEDCVVPGTPEERTIAKCNEERYNSIASKESIVSKHETSEEHTIDKCNGSVAKDTNPLEEIASDISAPSEDTKYSPEPTKNISRTTEPGSVLLKEIACAVSKYEQISVLKLNSCHLNQVPDDIHVLPLRELDLSKNLLREIPNCLYLGLSQLRNLNLSNNKLTEFERAPSCITCLKTLRLSKNKFPHPPEWILPPKSVLAELYYSHNPLVKLKKQATVNLSLVRLEMRNCLYFNIDLHYLRLFGKLEHLDLSNSTTLNLNHFDKLGELFKMLNLQSYLRVLKLDRLGIPEVPNTMGNLNNLREVNLSFNNLSKLPDTLVELSTLQVLKLANNQLFELPDGFNRLSELRVLEAPFNFISSIDLRSMHHLRYVDLYHNDLSEAHVENSVEMIDLDRNYVDGEEICGDYVQKRDLLRETGSTHFTRLEGCYSEEDYSNGSLGSLDLECTWSTENDVVAEVEDWDERCDIQGELNEVSLSDNEYQGEYFPEKWCPPYVQPFIDSCYDYLYEDAD